MKAIEWSFPVVLNFFRKVESLIINPSKKGFMMRLILFACFVS